MISLDVTSLFTNIPKELVKQSIERRFHQLSRISPIQFDEYLEVVEFLMKNTFFQFNNEFYKQIFGTPMGSSISPNFANIVMDDLESDCLSRLSFKPTFYYRYVDDIVTCIPIDALDETLSVFNSYHERLQFTYEIENNNRISFLDLWLIRENDKIITDWFQKPTFSGRILHFQSAHPLTQKIAIIYNLVDRALLGSDTRFHLNNIKKITKILQDNNYPIKMINKFIKKRKSYLHQRQNNSQSKITNTIINKQIKISIPYINSFF